MRRLKIAFLSYRSSPLSGGQGIYLKHVCEALVKQGHEITVFSGKPLPILDKNIHVEEVDTPGYFETFLFKDRVEIFKALKHKSFLEIEDFLKTLLGVFTEPIFFGQRLSENKKFKELKDSFDIFHDNQSISQYPRFMHKKLVTTLHHPIHVDRELDLRFEESFLSRLAIRQWYAFLDFQKKSLKQSRLVITPSHNSKKDIQKYFDVNSDAIEVIWNGMNTLEYKSSTGSDFKYRLLSIVSSDVPMKNLSNLIKGFALAKNKEPKLSLTVVGDIREKNKNLISSLGLDSSIRYRSKVSNEELLSELRSSDIGISASLYEGFGFPLIEMISCGLPVIVSERGSLPELMGEAGLSFNPDDANDLCDKIINMVNDVQLREDFIQKSIQRRGDFFGWDEYAMKLTELYQKITNGYI